MFVSQIWDFILDAQGYKIKVAFFFFIHLSYIVENLNNKLQWLWDYLLNKSTCTSFNFVEIAQEWLLTIICEYGIISEVFYWSTLHRWVLKTRLNVNVSVPKCSFLSIRHKLNHLYLSVQVSTVCDSSTTINEFYLLV